MSGWISTHGTGAVLDAKASFKVSVEEGGTTIQPTSATSKEGIVHFVLPSPPTNNPNITAVAVNFSAHAASITEVAVFFANDEMFRKQRLQKTDPFTLDIASGQATYNNQGIAVSIFVAFDQVSSAITFQSVGLKFA
ncbi:hypothetical protein BDV25DRAFT_136108 [Aspergillus avenaceus]|uniref:Uncharacterized protein n=1 Tax=Aspergillus avenaceus TaxID=36643 RepID=A0A5N6U6G2_ASPAV|nr:hypothetical protein BDV25DRAFT_136108 [Aspergillus avenaceus]